MSGLVALVALIGVLAVQPRLRSAASSKIRAAVDFPKSLAGSRAERSLSRGDFTDIVFLHHSVGSNLIAQGSVRERLAEVGYSLWDHGYNYQGLTRPDGSQAGYSYAVPDDNTDPDGLARIFAQPVFPWPANTFSRLLQHEVIVVKSCYLANHMSTDDQLAQYKRYYLTMREAMDEHPDKLFIVATMPPRNQAETDAKAAARARALSEWLTSNEYLDGHPNLAVFDLFHPLAENRVNATDYNTLKEAYRDGSDSHPNRHANEEIGPLFAQFVDEAVQRYRASRSASQMPITTPGASNEKGPGPETEAQASRGRVTCAIPSPPRSRQAVSQSAR